MPKKVVILTWLMLVFLSLVFWGCIDLKENVYSNLETEHLNMDSTQIIDLIGPVYSNMRELTGIFLTYYNLQELTTDEMVLPENSSGWDIAEFCNLHTWNSTSRWINADLWNILYAGVIHANRIIKQLEEKEIILRSDLQYDSLKAEMRVARAWYYWLLMDNYGNVPYVTVASDELPSQTPRAKTYGFLVAEIKAALSRLGEESMYGRFNKWGGMQLLANLYLNAEVYAQMPAYDSCLMICNEIIDSGAYRLEASYSDCFSAHNEHSVESVFAVPMDETNGSKMDIRFTLHASSQAKYRLRCTPFGAGGNKAVPQFVDTYDTLDTRMNDTYEQGLQYAYDGLTPLMCAYEKVGKQLNYTKDIKNGIYTLEDEGYRIIKYKPEVGAGWRMNNDFVFFRYAQVLMMKAECLLRMGYADSAAAIVTEVRKRAFKDHPEKAVITGAQLSADSKYNWGYYATDYALTKDSLLKGDVTPIAFGGMYDELGYEFAGEAYRRRDMIRFGTFTTKNWLSHTPKGAYRCVFPIPQSQLDANPKLSQNEGY